MQNTSDKYYEKILEAFAPLIKQAKELSQSTEGLTKSAEILSKALSELPETEQIANNIKNSLKPLIQTVELNKLGIRSREIAKLVEDGKLERVKQGYYRIVELSGEDSDANLIAQLYPDGVVTLETALFYYGYSDRTPLAWNIAIDRNTSKARFNIDYPYIQPHYIEKSHLQYGITVAEYEDCTLNIFDRDRLICECIYYETKMDRETFNKAIISYINDNRKNISNLMDYAKKRNVNKKVKDKVGVWL